MKRAALLVENNCEDAQSLKQGFKSAGLVNPVFIVENAEEAADYFSGTGAFSDREKFPPPAIILISMELPECAALQILHWLNQQPNIKNVLRLVLVRRSQLKQVVAAYELGAASFLVKPVNEDDLKNIVRSFPAHWERD